MKEDATMNWLVQKVRNYMEQGDQEIAQKFIDTYRPIIKDFNEERALDALKPLPPKSIREKTIKKKKEKKSKTYKTSKITKEIR